MLLYSPSYLFLLPGLFLILIGFGLLTYTYNTNPLRMHTMILGSLLTIVGFQVINFGISGKFMLLKKGWIGQIE